MAHKDKKCAVYKIVNTISGKVYVGSSMYVEKRLAAHKNKLKRGIHLLAELQQDWNQFGESIFKFIIIEEYPSTISNKELKDREQIYLDRENIKYNIATNAHNNLGILVKEEIRRKISATHISRRLLGKKHYLSTCVYQYGLDGTFIKKWDSRADIGRELGIYKSNLCSATNRGGTAYGFIWTNTYQGNKIEPRKPKSSHLHCKHVGMYSKNGKLIKVFRSQGDVCKYFNLSKSSIHSILLGTCEKTKGYNWREISFEEYNKNFDKSFKMGDKSQEMIKILDAQEEGKEELGIE